MAWTWGVDEKARLLACETDEEFLAAFPDHSLAGLKRRAREFKADPNSLRRSPPTRREILGKLADLVEKSGIDLDTIETIEKVRLNQWDGFSKGEDGEPRITPLEASQVVFQPKKLEGPSWPVVQVADPVVVRPARKLRVAGKWRTAVILPDPQIGYRRDIQTGDLDPFHDERAIAAALSVVADIQPDRVINLGDVLDMNEASRFIREPGFALTTQPAVNYATQYLARQRASAPNAQIDFLEGNHDGRLPKHIMENAIWAYGLTRGALEDGSTDAWPVLSVPNLLRMEELGVTYHPGYPAAIVWINDRLACVHGSKVRSNGSTASAVIDDEKVSVIFGHIHRIERIHKTSRTRSGAKTRLAASPGCLCRTDGAVPSTKGATDLYGRALTSFENWQQGLAIVTYREGDAPFAVELVAIHEGSAIVRGVEHAA